MSIKVKIINCWTSRYRRSDQHFVPSLTLPYLAALAPADVEVTLHHEQVRAIDFTEPADLIALSFPTGFALHAYRVADRYRELGIPVVMGGPHVTFLPDEALHHADAVVIGEAELTWRQLLHDFQRHQLRRVYRATELSDLADLPAPRYDLIEPDFYVPHIVQATRGCPYRCKFCTTPLLSPRFRTRPIAEVLRDIAIFESRAAAPLRWFQNKIVWFWDDNLTIDRAYAKQLLREMIPLRKWWLTQASLDLTQDEELLRLMHDSGCIGVFVGIESLNPASLADVKKHHNKVAQYKTAVRKLHDYGITVMAGLIIGFDQDTAQNLPRWIDQVRELAIDAPFLSIITPYYGTELYAELRAAGRILLDRDWSHYQGYGVTFQPAQMSVAELEHSHSDLWYKLHAPQRAAARLWHGVGRLRWGAWLLAGALNGYYSWKRVTGDVPTRQFEAKEQIGKSANRQTCVAPSVSQ